MTKRDVDTPKAGLLRDDQKKLLKAGGFRQVEFFGSYEGIPYDKEISSQMITVAQK